MIVRRRCRRNRDLHQCLLNIIKNYKINLEHLHLFLVYVSSVLLNIYLLRKVWEMYVAENIIERSPKSSAK